MIDVVIKPYLKGTKSSAVILELANITTDGCSVDVEQPRIVGYTDGGMFSYRSYVAGDNILFNHTDYFNSPEVDGWTLHVDRLAGSISFDIYMKPAFILDEAGSLTYPLAFGYTFHVNVDLVSQLIDLGQIEEIRSFVDDNPLDVYDFYVEFGASHYYVGDLNPIELSDITSLAHYSDFNINTDILTPPTSTSTYIDVISYSITANGNAQLNSASAPEVLSRITVLDGEHFLHPSQFGIVDSGISTLLLNNLNYNVQNCGDGYDVYVYNPIREFAITYTESGTTYYYNGEDWTTDTYYFPPSSTTIHVSDASGDIECTYADKILESQYILTLSDFTYDYPTDPISDSSSTTHFKLLVCMLFHLAYEDGITLDDFNPEEYTNANHIGGWPYTFKLKSTTDKEYTVEVTATSDSHRFTKVFELPPASSPGVAEWNEFQLKLPIGLSYDIYWALVRRDSFGHYIKSSTKQLADDYEASISLIDSLRDIGVSDPVIVQVEKNDTTGDYTFKVALDPNSFYHNPLLYLSETTPPTISVGGTSFNIVEGQPLYEFTSTTPDVTVQITIVDGLGDSNTFDFSFNLDDLYEELVGEEAGSITYDEWTAALLDHGVDTDDALAEGDYIVWESQIRELSAAIDAYDTEFTYSYGFRIPSGVVAVGCEYDIVTPAGTEAAVKVSVNGVIKEVGCFSDAGETVEVSDAVFGQFLVTLKSDGRSTPIIRYVKPVYVKGAE